MKGCFHLSRQIFESPIWRDNPHNLKLFIYLVGLARHREKPKRFPGFSVKRGELVTSLVSIAEDNEYLERNRTKTWSKQRVSRMLQYLEKNGYITKLADTYGTHIRICNYNKFQDLINYKADRSVTDAGQVRDRSVTDAGTYKNDNNVKNDKKKKDRRMKFKPDWINEKLWLELLENRKFKKLQNTELALKTFTNALWRGCEAGYPIEVCIGEFVASKWTRFNHEWINGKGKQQKTNMTARQQYMTELGDTLEAIENGVNNVRDGSGIADQTIRALPGGGP